MSAIDRAALAEAQDALAPLPTADGGRIVILATAGTPPAVALLSSGDVLVEHGAVRAGLYAGASAARRLDGGFTLLVPTGQRAVRIEATAATARRQGDLDVLQGEIVGVRPTAEPPWAIEMRFYPTASVGVHAQLTFWRDLRAWLQGGAKREPPPLPPH